MNTDLTDLVRTIAREEALKVVGAQPERAVTVKAAAIRLSVDEKTVRRLIQRGELRGVRVGSRALRVVASDLDRLLGTSAS